MKILNILTRLYPIRLKCGDDGITHLKKSGA